MSEPIFIQLKNAEGKAVFPRIDLSNVESDHLLKGELVKVGVTEDAKPITLVEKLNALTQQIAGLNYFSFKAENRPEIPEAADELTAFWETHRYTVFLEKRVAAGDTKALDICDEYILVPTFDEEGAVTALAWELIGNTELDLSGYYTSGQINDLIKNLKVNGRKVFADVPEDVRALDVKLENYAKAAEAADIAANDNVQTAIGKLEKRVSDLKDATDTSFTNYAVNGVKFSAAEDYDVTVDGSIAVGTYAKAEEAAAIASTDSVKVALSKLEFKADDNAADIKALQDFIQPDLFEDFDNFKDWIESELAKKLNANATVNGVAFDNHAVVIDGSDIELTGMTVGTADDITKVAAVDHEDTVNGAVSKLANMASLAVYYEVIEVTED